MELLLVPAAKKSHLREFRFFRWDHCLLTFPLGILIPESIVEIRVICLELNGCIPDSAVFREIRISLGVKSICLMTFDIFTQIL